MKPISNEVLAERIEFTKQIVDQIKNEDLQEMKDDIKVIKEQVLKTNGRVNKHDDEMVYLKQGVKAFWDKENQERIEAKDKIKKLKSTLLKVGIGIAAGSTAVNELQELIRSVIHTLWIK